MTDAKSGVWWTSITTGTKSGVRWASIATGTNSGCGGQISELISKKKHTLILLDYLDNFFSHDKSLAFLFNFRQKVVGMGQK